MTAMAAPPGALSAIAQPPPEPPEATPPDGHDFHGALEDSLARTATAEGHKQESVKQASGAIEGESAKDEQGPTPSETADSSAPAGAGAQTAGPTSTGTQQTGEAPASEGSKASESGKGRGHHKHAVAGSQSAPAIQADGSSAVVTADASAASSGSNVEAAHGLTTVAGDATTSVDVLTVAGDQAGATSGQASSNSGSANAADGRAATAPPAAAGQSSTGAGATPTPDGGGNAGQAQSLPASSAAAGNEIANAPSASSEATKSGSQALSAEYGGAMAESSAGPEGASTPAGVRAHLPWLDTTSRGGGQSASGTATGTESARPSEGRLGSAGEALLGSSEKGARGSATQSNSHTALATKLAPGSSSTTGISQTSASGQVSTSSTAGNSEAGGSAVAPDIAAATPSPAAESTPWSYGPNMQQTIETIHATVALASRQGAASAQIQLEPAELGAVKIHLTQTSEGLLARVSTETAAGARAIASGHSELHQTLSSLGISLLRLDVGGSFARQEASAQGNAPQGSQLQAGRPASLGEEAEEAASLASTTAVSLSTGSALIDVLA